MTKEEKHALDKAQHDNKILSDELFRLTARVDDLVVKMNDFRCEAMRLLNEMSEAHAPKGAAQ